MMTANFLDSQNLGLLCSFSSGGTKWFTLKRFNIYGFSVISSMVLMVAGCYLVRAQAKNDLDVIRLSAGIFAIHFECIMSVYFLRYQCCFPLIIPCAPAIKINIDTKQNMAAHCGPSLPSTFYILQSTPSFPMAILLQKGKDVFNTLYFFFYLGYAGLSTLLHLAAVIARFVYLWMGVIAPCTIGDHN